MRGADHDEREGRTEKKGRTIAANRGGEEMNDASEGKLNVAPLTLSLCIARNPDGYFVTG